jgi:hypothetical protein
MMVLFPYRGKMQESLDLLIKNILLVVFIGIEDYVKVAMTDENTSF